MQTCRSGLRLVNEALYAVRPHLLVMEVIVRSRIEACWLGLLHHLRKQALMPE
jgi:hypothetical protein